jgi:hypothetical protein
MTTMSLYATTRYKIYGIQTNKRLETRDIELKKCEDQIDSLVKNTWNYIFDKDNLFELNLLSKEMMNDNGHLRKLVSRIKEEGK